VDTEGDVVGVDKIVLLDAAARFTSMDGIFAKVEQQAVVFDASCC
jgi:hypothetical protein